MGGTARVMRPEFFSWSSLAGTERLRRWVFLHSASSVTFRDMYTLTVLTPALSPGAQRVTSISPDGETVSLDAALPPIRFETPRFKSQQIVFLTKHSFPSSHEM